MNVTLFGNKVFVDIINLRRDHTGFRIISVFIRRPCEDTEIQTQMSEHNMKMKAEIGVMHLQAKEHQEGKKHQKLRRHKEGGFPRVLRGSMAVLTL